MNKITRLPRLQRAQWDLNSLEVMFCGVLQAEFSDLVREYLPGVETDEYDMVRCEEFNTHLSKGISAFFEKLGGASG